MARTLDQLAIIANQIKDATLQGENTADRVGGLLVDLIDFLRTINVDEITLSPLLTALNESGLVDPQDGQILRFKSSEDNWVFSSDITQITSTIRTIIDTLGQLDNRFVKKTGDIMTGLLTTLAGIKVRNFLQLGDRFVSGLLGEGAIFRENIGGRTYLEADEIYIRVKAYFDTVEIKKFLHSGGNRIASLGGAKCVRVEMLNSNNEVVTQNPTKYRCYFRASDGDDTITNDFVVGDQAYCHVTNATNSSLSMHHYWRLVIGKNELPNENGEHWIDLSNQESETIDGIVYSGYLNISDAPAAQDDIIQLGNVNDSTRRGAIIEFVSGNDAPAYQIFQDLGSIGSATTIAQKHDAQYSYNGKNYISMGYSSSTGRAFMNVYGDFLFGDPEESTYVKYNAFTKQLDIKATVRFISPTTHQETTLDTFASVVTGGLESLQRQIDGEIDTWFYNGTPGPSVLPESEWVAIDTRTGTNNERLKHLGDLYYDNSTGYAYRYSNTGSEASPVFTWSQISDSAVIKALEDAAKAQDTADHKRRVFVTAAGVLPTPPYSEGDLWMNVTYPANATMTDAANNIYYNDILRCKVPATYNQHGELVREGVETGETALITHWQLSSKYTDDSKFDYFFTNTYSPFVTSIQQQVDKKAETYRQATSPASSWADADKPKHVGDLWMDTSANGGNKTYIYQNTGTEANPNYQWVAQAVPEEVFDKIDGKAAIYVGWEDWIVDGVSQLQDKDLYVPNTDHNPYKANKVYRWRASDSTWNEIHYTDDTTVNNFISGAYATFVSNIQEQVDKKAETWRQSTDPSLAQGWVASSHVGDIWMDTDQNNGHNTYIYVSNGGGTYGWEPQAVPDEVFDEIDGKAEIFVQKPTTYHERDMWIIESSTTTCPDADIPANCKRGDIVVASSDSNSYNKTHWAKKDRYTDDTVANSALTAITNLSNNSYVQDLIGGSINQAITDGDAAAVQQAAQAAQTTYGYLTQALNQDTVIEGGLVLTSLIALRDRNSNVWSGISGTYIDRTTPNPEDPSEPYAKGHGIAAWYGGENIDHEAFPALTNYAKSLFRFDGSGYLASGNITWDDSGNLIVQGQAIKATTYYLNGQNITDALNAVLTMFTLEGAGTAANPYVIKANFGLYSVGGITALGQGSQGGGGGGSTTLYGLNDVSKNAAGDGVLGAADGYVLTYNATTNHWYAAPTAPIYSAGIGLALSSNTFSINSTYQTYISHGESAYNSLSNYLPLSGGTLTNDLTISNGANLNLQAAQGSSDSGDIVFKDGSGNEIGRFWKSAGANTFNVRFDAYSDGYSVVHSGNIGSQSVNYASSAGNADTVDGYHAYASNNTPWGTIPVITSTGYMDVGKHFEFHYDNTTGSDYSTALVCTGNYSNIVALPSSSGTLALTSQIPTNNNQLTNGAGYITSSGSCAYASSAGSVAWGNVSSKPTTLSGYGITDGLYSAQVTVAQTDLTYAKDASKTIRRGFTYNTSGAEWSYLFGFCSSSTSAGYPQNGAVLKMSYADKYLRILRSLNGTWQSSDWEKISAGYADSAGSVDWTNVSGRPTNVSSFTNDSGYYKSGDTPTFNGIKNSGYYYMKYGDSWYSIIDNDGNGPIFGYAQMSRQNVSYFVGYYVRINGGSAYNSTDGIVVNSSNNVGIGTASPSYKLHVEGTSYMAYNTPHYFRDGNNTRSGLYYGTGGDEALSVVLRYSLSSFQVVTNSDIASWNSSTWQGVVPDIQVKEKALYVNALIGQDERPSYNLYVNGAARFTSDITVGGSIYIQSYLLMPDSSGNWISTIDRSSSNPIFGYGQGQNGYHVYYTGGTVSINAGNSWNAKANGIYINASNNVGIGTSSPSEKLHVAGTFYTSGAATFDGYVGIGTSSPSHKLHVNGDAKVNSLHASSIEFSGVSSSAGHGGFIDFHFNNSSADYTTRLIEESSGTLKLYGDFFATGGVTSLSDARHKTIMGNTKLRVEQIADMPAITYKWIDRRDNDLHVGSIAQDWQRILPEVVSVANDLEGTLSINYGVAAMIASIVTAKKVVDHEARIKALESECERLREENKQLRLKIA